MNWAYFLLGLIAWQILKMLALAINRVIIERRQRKFLKLVSIRFPDRKDIKFITVDSTDKRSMQKMERELREQYGLTPKDTEESQESYYLKNLRLPRRGELNDDEVSG